MWWKWDCVSYKAALEKALFFSWFFLENSLWALAYHVRDLTWQHWGHQRERWRDRERGWCLGSLSSANPLLLSLWAQGPDTEAKIPSKWPKLQPPSDCSIWKITSLFSEPPSWTNKTIRSVSQINAYFSFKSQFVDVFAVQQQIDVGANSRISN